MDKIETTPLLDIQAETTRNDIKARHFVLVPVLINSFLSLGMAFYVQNQWIQNYIKENLRVSSDLNATSGCTEANHSDPAYIAFTEIQKDTALWQMYALLATFVPLFFSVLILPAYSDSFGRRFLFILGSLGSTLKMAGVTFVIYFKLSLIWIVVAAIVEGITGGYAVLSSGVYSYIADLSQPGRQRTIAFTFLDAVYLICITFSGLGVGFFIAYYGYFIPMATSAGMSLVNLILIVFLLPETHTRNRVHEVAVLDNLTRVVSFYVGKIFAAKRCAYILLLSAFIFIDIASTHREGIEMLYQLGRPFCWDSLNIGYFSAARHVTQGIANMLLIAPLKKCLSDVNIAIMSTVFCGGSYVLEAFAKTNLILYLVSIPATFAYLTLPMVKGIMSGMTAPDKQGSLFAGILAADGMCNILANLLLNNIYKNTVSFFNGFVFLFLAALSGVVFIQLVIFAVTQKKHITTPAPEETGASS